VNLRRDHFCEHYFFSRGLLTKGDSALTKKNSFFLVFLYAFKSVKHFTSSLHNGRLGSCIDEERSERRNVM
jgi:hypothetical protein